MNRRQLLKLLVSGVVAPMIDPEQLLWTPNRKTYFVLDGVTGRSGITYSEIVAAEYARVMPRVRALFERDDMFYANIAKRDVEVVSTREIRIPLTLRPYEDGDIEWNKALIIKKS